MSDTPNYPALTRAVRLLADDNYLRLLKATRWVWPDADDGVDLPTLETKVAALTDGQLMLAVCGGESDDGINPADDGGPFIDHNAYCEANNLGDLDWFLNEIFEGEFRNHFVHRTR